MCLQRVTTSCQLFEDHPRSFELWSPGGALFPKVSVAAKAEPGTRLRAVLERARHGLTWRRALLIRASNAEMAAGAALFRPRNTAARIEKAAGEAG